MNKIITDKEKIERIILEMGLFFLTIRLNTEKLCWSNFYHNHFSPLKDGCTEDIFVICTEALRLEIDLVSWKFLEIKIKNKVITFSSTEEDAAMRDKKAILPPIYLFGCCSIDIDGMEGHMGSSRRIYHNDKWWSQYYIQYLPSFNRMPF